MTNIPSNLARVPNALASQIILESLLQSQRGLLATQIQLATGRRINHASDDALATSVVSVLDDVIERRDQRLRNLSHADAVLNNVDAALADGSDLLIEAQSIASGQIGVGSDEDTRRNQAAVIDSLVNEMLAIANRKFQNIHLFGGNATARAPMTELLGGIRYGGDGHGLVNDLGVSNSIAITMSGADAFGALSERVRGNFDLDPTMTGNTRLIDLEGARGLGVTLGEINLDVNGTDVSVDLSSAHTVQDVVAELEAAIQTVDAGAVVQIDPATNNRFEIIPSGGVTVTISDLPGGFTAADLGIGGVFAGPGGATGADVAPKLTEHTLITSLTGVTVPMGTIRLENAGQTRNLDLSGVTTIQELANAVEGLNIGIRVEIADTGDRLDFINELSGTFMAIGEVGGGTTATELGVRTLAPWTRLEDFNDGLGVQIKTGSVDPITGVPDPTADTDFRLTLKDGSIIDVDLAGAETVQDVLDAINNAATIAGVPLLAGLATDGNGIALADSTVGVGATTLEALNGSFAAEDLGIVGTTTGAVLLGEDRAKVAADSIFTHLISVREALLANDERGITLAADRFEQDISRLAEARADVGVRSRRVASSLLRQEDLRIQDMALRSEIQDLDYTEASLRFATLQQQLQAGLLTAQQVTSLSLLDFLG